MKSYTEKTTWGVAASKRFVGNKFKDYTYWIWGADFHPLHPPRVRGVATDDKALKRIICIKLREFIDQRYFDPLSYI